MSTRGTHPLTDSVLACGWTIKNSNQSPELQRGEITITSKSLPWAQTICRNWPYSQIWTTKLYIKYILNISKHVVCLFVCQNACPYSVLALASKTVGGRGICTPNHVRKLSFVCQFYLNRSGSHLCYKPYQIQTRKGGHFYGRFDTCLL